MNRRLMVWPTAIGVVIAAVVGVAYSSAMRVDLDVPSARPSAPSVLASRSVSRETERDAREVQLVVWGQALAADSISALAMGQLDGFHIQKACERGVFG